MITLILTALRKLMSGEKLNEEEEMAINKHLEQLEDMERRFKEREKERLSLMNNNDELGGH